MKQVIELRHRVYEAGFHSRLVWAELFDYYRKHDGNLDDMDSFLCDLKLIETFFNRHIETMYWIADPKTGVTDLTKYMPASRCQMIRTKIRRMEDTIEVIFEPDVEFS